MEFIPPLQTQESVFSRLDEHKIGQLKNKAESGEYQNEEELKKLAKQFESVFVNLLMKSMRETVPKEGLISSFSLDMYQSMFDQEVASVMSESRGKGIGLADVLYTQLSRINEDKPVAKGGSEKPASLPPSSKPSISEGDR